MIGRDKFRRQFGVNVAGHLNSEKGVGEAVRSAVRILQAGKVPIALNNFPDPGAVNSDSTYARFTDGNPYPVNLIVLGSDAMSFFVQEMGDRYFANHYNIAHWAWELSDVPPEFLSNLKCLDELWVASSFIQAALSKLVSIPVTTVPYALTGQRPTGTLHRLHFGLPKNKFVFLFIFDFHSYMERKNPIGLVKAFKRAFSRDDDALLILKTSHSEWAAADLRALQLEAKDANVRITDCNMSREQVRLLMHFSDCYISLHRAEGFGLTMAEAMALEKPVIATGYSGNMDYMTDANSFPVAYKLAPIEKDQGPYRRGFIWADPDLDCAAALMRHVFENRDAARQVGIKARQDIIGKLTPELLAPSVRARLEKVPAR